MVTVIESDVGEVVMSAKKVEFMPFEKEIVSIIGGNILSEE